MTPPKDNVVRVRSTEMIRADLALAFADGDTTLVAKLTRELADAPLLERAGRIVELKRIIAELDGQRPELHAAAAAARQRAIAATDAIREAEQHARMVARDSWLAQNRLQAHNEHRRSLQAELDGLLAALNYEGQIMGAPIVHDLTRLIPVTKGS